MLFLGALVSARLSKLKKGDYWIAGFWLLIVTRITCRAHRRYPVCLLVSLYLLAAVSHQQPSFCSTGSWFWGTSVRTLPLWVPGRGAGWGLRLVSHRGRTLAACPKLRWAQPPLGWQRTSRLSRALIDCFGSPAVLRLFHILTFIIWGLLSATDNFPRSWRRLLIHAFLGSRQGYFVLSASTLSLL